jgi:hypothetical protein
VANNLSQVGKSRLRVAIVGRSMANTSRLSSIANARAAIFGSRVAFQPLEIREFTALAFSRLLRSLKPKIVFHVASLQSPWESAAGQNRWTRLMASAGFGITLPLQMALAAETSRAASDGKAAIINASYPDCVNVVLQRLGLRVTCGIGNAAIVEALCRSHAMTGGGDVRIVGHHGHLASWLKSKRSADQPRIWIRNREVDPLRLSPNLGAIGEQLNHVTSATAVSVILTLLSGETRQLSVPGVAGLPGGYPFAIKNQEFKLRLPSGISIEEAVAHNKTGERADGLELNTGVTFVRKVREALASVDFEYAQGFDLADWSRVRDRMVALRDRLRRTSA